MLGREGQISALADRGLTRREIAAQIGLKVTTVESYCSRFKIKTARDNAGWAPVIHAAKTRADEMAELYSAGYTLQQIGQRFEISRERVRQLLRRYTGVTREDGGQGRRAAARKSHRQSILDAKTYVKYGCSWREYRELLSLAGAPVAAFRQQRRNAARRGIEWRLTLSEWWRVWRDSGHWAERGRGKYMMCRIGDLGPYALGNVHIDTGANNGKFQPNNPYRKSHPDHARVMAELASRREQRSAA